MKKLFVVFVLALFAGCTVQQQADLTEAGKIQRVIQETKVKLETIKADANLAEVEKISAYVDTVATKAEEVGLIQPEQTGGFTNGLNMAMDAYLAFAPLGAAKMDWTLLIALAVVALRKKKGYK